MRDAGAEDREDGGRAFATEIAVGEEPVFSSEYERPQLPFNTVVRELKPSVGQEQDEALPLAVEGANRLAERRLWRGDGALVSDPRAQLVDRRRAIFATTTEALFGRLAVDGREALDGEEASDHAQRDDGKLIAGPRAGDEATAPMAPAAGALTASALEEGEDARAVAL